MNNNENNINYSEIDDLQKNLSKIDDLTKRLINSLANKKQDKNFLYQTKIYITKLLQNIFQKCYQILPN